MKKRTDAEKATPMPDDVLEEQIYNALIEKGWVIPQTEEDVRLAEEALAQVECPLLPPELVDPYSLFDRLDEESDEGKIRKVIEVKGGITEASDADLPVKEGTAENASSPATHVSVLAELRHHCKMPASQIAVRMNVPVPFLAAVGRYPKSVPRSWREELAARAERNLGILGSVVLNAFECPYHAPMAASRETAYETDVVTVENILDQSGLDEELRSYWLSLAVEG